MIAALFAIAALSWLYIYLRMRPMADMADTAPAALAPGAADWADVAAEHGYTDQAHLIHDFRALTGITPTAYRPRSVEERNHVPLAASGP